MQCTVQWLPERGMAFVAETGHADAKALLAGGNLREWLAGGPKTKGNLKLEVDVDPQSFL